MSSKTNDARILIADDIPRNLQLLGKLLTDEGYKIAAVTKGEQVIPSVEKFNPDLILLDVMMPDKNGFEVCKDLQTHPEYADIPVIFLTGKAEQEDVIEGLKIGGSDYITKPFNTQELLIRVKTHVDLKKSKDKITLQKQELEKVNATKDKLYSVIGHDLKNALFGALGFADLLLNELKEHEVPDSIREKAAFIHTSAQKMSRLLENLLDWARLQTGNLLVGKTSFSVERTVEEAMHLLKTTAAIKKIKLMYEGPQEATAVGDKRIIETIARNLISNAIKFSEKESTIDVKLEEVDSMWEVSVRDYGTGMNEEVRKNLFDVENRPVQSGTENEVGTGLGLVLCKELIEKHEGTIRVESDLGKGSTFTISFPKMLS